MAATGVKIVAKNQKAYHEYFIEEKFEAGIELSGTEVKSIRLGTLSLKEAWCQIKDGQLYIRQMHIAPYEQGNIFNVEELRTRKLLLNKKEIAKIDKELSGTGITFIPLKVYLKNGFAKVLMGLARGKKDYDKRETLKRKEQNRDIARQIKAYNR